MSTRMDSASAPAASTGATGNTADMLLLSSYDWERDRETITLGDAVQRFRDVMVMKGFQYRPSRISSSCFGS